MRSGWASGRAPRVTPAAEDRPPAESGHRRVVDVHGRQVLDLLLGEVEPDTVIDAGHGADRDGDFLAARQVPLLEEHVGHVVAVRVDDQALDFPDVAVGGMDVIAAAHLHLIQRDGVVGDRLRGVSPGHAHAHARAVVGHVKHLFRVIARVSGRAGQELCLLGGIELLELLQGAAEPDLACRGVDEVKRNKPAAVIAMLGFDHEMGDRARDRVHDHAGHLAAAAVGTAGVGPDHERCCLCHRHPPRSLAGPSSRLVNAARAARAPSSRTRSLPPGR